MTKTTDAWIGAAEAARELGVTRPTLYAYVSRGFIRSEIVAGSSRERRYSRDDVERMKRRAEERRAPDKVAAHALQWGLPILESSITLIADGRLYYRGADAVHLARTGSVEDVAALIWTGGADDVLFAARSIRAGRLPSLDVPFVARAQAALAIASATDAAAFDLRPRAVALTGARIMRLLTRVASTSATFSRSASAGIAESLAAGWGIKPDAAALLRAALILCADHELNVSAFTARCVASADSHPYAVVIAGLAALEGTKHGGMTSRVEALLSSLRRTPLPRLDAALADRLRRGERIDGFGHPLYRDGDPRATALLEMLHEHFPKSPELAFATRLADAGEALTRERPNLDFALATVSRVLKLPEGSGIALFAIGRTIGWIGQAIEQYATGQMIRPRAKYVGQSPRILRANSSLSGEPGFASV